MTARESTPPNPVTELVRPDAPPRELRGYGMNDRFGPFVSAFARRYLDSIHYPPEMAARIRKLAQQGVVVYVHRTQNIAEHLALQRAVYRHELPVARFTGGLNVATVQPWWRFPREKRTGTRADNQLRLLRTCVEAGFSAQLFLRRPLTLINAKTAQRIDYVAALIDLCKERDLPIFLVPHFLALRSEPGKFEPTAADAIFGSADAPGTLRALARLMLSRNVARFEVSEPISLRAFLHQQGKDLPTAALAKKVRWSILHHLARIERIAHGPPLKSPARMREDVFKDALLQKAIGEQATKRGVTRERVRREAEKMYEEIAAKPDFDWARMMDKLLRLIWRVIYDGLIINKTDIARIRQAARDGPLVLVPSHRSHVDYLVMSQAFLWNGLLPPYVAAGNNLNFFPLGPILRRGGGYFIRRTFHGEPLYPHVFRAYVRRLYREGFTQEFFIEGGRSRTGKTLAPKLGMLRMLIDAYLESRQPDAVFVPASIAYEKIIEAGAYSRELKGGEKEAESATALIRTAGVLTSRYGRVFITFHDPISLRTFLRRHGTTKEELLKGTEEERRHLVQTLAFRIVYGINSAVQITPNALLCLVLFGFRGRGIEREELAQTIDIALAHIMDQSEGKARLSPGLDHAPMAAVEAAVALLMADKSITVETVAGRTFYRAAPSGFLELEFYKNNIIHFFVPEAILATAMRAAGARPGRPVDRAEVKALTLQFSRVFKFEFIFREGDFTTLFRQTLARADKNGVLDIEDTTLTLRDEKDAKRWGAFSANLVSNFVDTYWSVAKNLRTALPGAAHKKALTQSLLEHARADLIAEDIVCPEAVSKANIENCLQLLVDQQILLTGDKGLSLIDGSAAALDDMQELLDRARLGRLRSS